MQQPTQVELEILKALWRKEPQTAREIHELISDSFDWSYSSTRKTLERMGDKGMVTLENFGNKKIYFAKLEKLKTLAFIAKDFSSRVFQLGGSIPAAMFAQSEIIDESEIAELERLLNEDSSTEDNRSQ